ncbi:hypothetical protein [Runella zeae]|uniref:hypothetical protein n=1 Tax=Runella zeae TaxID=94255 RepID=UPI0004070509|nr:hypothetical protein [Runella zeae]
MASKNKDEKQLKTLESPKTYEELFDYDQIVVQVGPRYELKNNKPVVVEEARLTTMTKGSYELMERDSDGDTKVIPVKALGHPDIKIEDDPRSPGGKKKTLDYIPFAVIADEIPDTEKSDQNPPQ